MIEHLLRTTEEQSRKYESLKAAIGCNENTDGNRDATHGCIPSIPDLDAENMPREAPNKSRTERLLDAPKVHSMTIKVENYYTLMEHLMAEIEAKKYNIEPDVRRRIRDDVIRTHEREIWLLRAIHEYAESKEKMREKPWRLLEIAEDIADQGKHPRIEKRGQSSSGAKPGPFPSDLGAQFLDPDQRYSFQESETQKQMDDKQGSSTKARTTAMDRIPAPTISATELFLDNREDPWNPLKAQMPFLRSCTSMLVTETCHIVKTEASLQDLPALTDSTDTDTFVSARSEFGEMVLDTYPLRLKGGEKDAPLAVFGDQGYSDATEKNDGRLGVASFDSYLNELLAS